MELIVESTTKKLNLFLTEVKKYSSSNKDVAEIEKEINSKLITVLKLHHGFKNLDLSANLKNTLTNILPKSEFEWGIILSWLFIHQLGRVISENKHELKSRSLFDEWRLSKYIANTLKELSIKKDEKKLEVVSIIKLMVSLQNWANSIDYSEKNFYAIFQSFLREPEIQGYLKVNRYHNHLWYSAEKFANFTRWIWITAIIDKIAKNKDHATKELNELLTFYQRIEEIAKNSKYQVTKFLEDLQTIS